MIEKVLPGLHRVVVPLPGNPLKEINSYVLTSGDRNPIIDTGMKRPECQEVLEAGLDEIGVDLERTDFISTHLHAHIDPSARGSRGPDLDAAPERLPRLHGDSRCPGDEDRLHPPDQDHPID
jgi:glyoxylase-like metal-dependent hydrolase (beta-lactamase superfamily II)